MPDPTPTRLPKYRHYKPKDLAVVRIDGRDHYLGRFGSEESQEKYRRLVAGWLAGTPTAVPEADNDAEGISVAELMLAFMKWADGYYRKDGRPTTEPVNIRLALRPIRQLYGLTPACDFGPRALKTVRQAMIDAGLCRNECNKRTRIVVRLFKWGVEQELVSPSVLQGLKAVAGLRKGRSAARESEPVRPVEDELVDAVQPFVSRQVWAMIELQRLTGMRPGEVVLMRTGDIDRSGRVWEYVPHAHKTEHHGRDRRIYLGPKAQEVLHPWLRADPAAYLFSPAEATQERNAGRRRVRRTPMTPSQHARTRKQRPRKSPGERYTTCSYAHAVSAACRRAAPHPTLSRLRKRDLTDEQRAELRVWHRANGWHPHQLRHSAATVLRKEFGLDVARVILGHSSPAVTEVYAEVDREKARAVMAEVG
jgi:integrase